MLSIPVAFCFVINNMTQTSPENKGFITSYRILYLGKPRQALNLRPWRNAAYGIALHGLLSLFS